MYAIAKTTNIEDRTSWIYMDAAGDFGRIEDARPYDDLETARGVARVMWWEARDEERVFVVGDELPSSLQIHSVESLVQPAHDIVVSSP